MQVWVEGYMITGGGGRAQLIGKVPDATTLEEAIEELIGKGELEGHLVKFNSGKPHTYWGCRMFDNYAEAAESYG